MRENRLYGSVGGWGLNRPPPTQSIARTAPPLRGLHHDCADRYDFCEAMSSSAMSALGLKRVAVLLHRAVLKFLEI